MPRAVEFLLQTEAKAQTALRRFSVHAEGEARHQWELILAENHDAAAVGYLEQHSPAVSDPGEVRVIVTACDSGEEHCFRIDLNDGGEARPCD
jgi:hypothetical protein